MIAEALLHGHANETEANVSKPAYHGASDNVLLVNHNLSLHRMSKDKPNRVKSSHHPPEWSETQCKDFAQMQAELEQHMKSSIESRSKEEDKSVEVEESDEEESQSVLEDERKLPAVVYNQPHVVTATSALRRVNRLVGNLGEDRKLRSGKVLGQPPPPRNAARLSRRR
jgi:vesicle coat complex subunit